MAEDASDPAARRSGPASAPGLEDAGHPRRWAILAALCAALLLVVLDNTVLNVAVPAIADAFAAGTAGLQAVIDAYVVVFAGLLITAGVAADRFGRRRVVLAGLVVFAVASGAAALAGTIWWLIAMRGVMGVGAALVMPSTLAVLVQVFPAAERPRAFAVWAAVAAVGMAVGPVLGGFLVAAWSWAGVFLINVPVAAAAMVGVVWLVPESREPGTRRLDPGATVLVTIGMLALITAIILAGEAGPASPVVVVTAVVAAGALGGFGWSQRRAHEPMVDFRLYRNRSFAGASAAAALLTVGTGSALFVLTQYLQGVRGFSALQAGAGLIPLAVGTVVGSRWGGRAPARIGARAAIAVGFALVAAGFVVLATLGPSSSYLVVAAGLLLGGAGTGFATPAATSTLLGAVPRQRAGMGSARHDTPQQLGIALGVAALGTLLVTAYRAGLPQVVPEAAGSALATTLSWAAGRPDAAALVAVARAAFSTAQTTTMLVAAGCALAGAAIAMMLLPDDRPRRSS